MNSPNDGGPAFPSQENVNDPRVSGLIFTQGMSLRDYFAARALQAMLARDKIYEGIAYEGLTAQDVAGSSYEWADLMLAARERKEKA